MKNNNLKSCTDCKFIFNDGAFRCSHPKAFIDEIPVLYEECLRMRKNARACGREAKLFEPKPPSKLKRIINKFKRSK